MKFRRISQVGSKDLIHVDAARFPLGRMVATPGAVEALSDAKTPAWELLARHVAGDFGDVGEDDQKANWEAVQNGERVLSAYTLKTGVKLWVITEADRSSTALLLPDEY